MRLPSTFVSHMRTHVVGYVALFFAVSGGAAVAVASIPDGQSLIHGCILNTDGANLKIIDSELESCPEGTEGIQWRATDAPSSRWYRDADSDGFGDWYEFRDSATEPLGFVGNNGDCDDSNPNIHAVGPEGVGNDPAGGGNQDCDEFADEDRAREWFYSSDGDAYGCARPAQCIGAGAPPRRVVAVQRPGPNYVLNPYDCNDRDRRIGAYQCLADTRRRGDADGDGHRLYHGDVGTGDDCDDLNPRRFPGSVELKFDGLDNDCDVQTYDVILYDPNYLRPERGGLGGGNLRLDADPGDGFGACYGHPSGCG